MLKIIYVNAKHDGFQKLEWSIQKFHHLFVNSFSFQEQMTGSNHRSSLSLFQERSRSFDGFSMHSLENSLIDIMRAEQDSLKGTLLAAILTDPSSHECLDEKSLIFFNREHKIKQMCFTLKKLTFWQQHGEERLFTCRYIRFYWMHMPGGKITSDVCLCIGLPGG